MLVKNLLKQTDQLLTFNSTLDKKYEFQLCPHTLFKKPSYLEKQKMS